MLDEVIKKILFLHRQQEKKYHFVVSSSHELSREERQRIEEFIMAQIENHISTTFVVDKSLISGIRIKGKRFLWERSIAKQLRNIKQKLSREGD